MNKAIEYARQQMRFAQKKMCRVTNLRGRPVDWNVGDLVSVLTKHWNIDRPSKKLSEKWYGPVKVIERYEESWKLDLPNNIRVHPIFHSNSLRKYLNNPLTGQRRPEPAPIQVLPDEEEWELEKIIGVRMNGRKLECRFKFVGADDDYNWYSCSDAMTAPYLDKDFNLNYPNAPGPPKLLPDWVEAYNKGIDDYSYLRANGCMNQTTRTRFFAGGG